MKIIKFLNNTITYITICVALYITLITLMFTLCYNSVFSTKNPSYFDMSEVLLSILLACFIIICIYYGKNHIIRFLDTHDLKFYIIIAISAVTIISFSWMTATGYVAATDIKIIVKNAIDIYSNTKSQRMGYIDRFPYQSGILLYALLFIMITGNKLDYDGIYHVMEYVNIIPVCITVLMLILITKELSNERTAKITALIISGFITIPLSAVQVYGNIISLPIILISVYFTIKICKHDDYNNSSTIKFFIIMIIANMISGALKTNNLIFGIAESIIIILTVFNDKVNVRTTVIRIIIGVMILPSMILGNMIAIGIVKSTGFYDFNSEDKQPSIVFIGMGLSDESIYGPGTYFSRIGDYKTDIEYSKNESIRIINNRINELTENTGDAIDFFLMKTIYTWSDPTFSYYTKPPVAEYNISTANSESMNMKGIKKILYNDNTMVSLRILMDALSIIITSFACSGLITHRKDKIRYFLLSLIITGGFLFHLFWETKPEYAYTYFILFIPYAAIGLSTFMQKQKMILISHENENRSVS